MERERKLKREKVMDRKRKLEIEGENYGKRERVKEKVMDRGRKLEKERES